MVIDRIFIRNKERLTETELRNKYGIVYGIYGIALNLVLFACKLFAGMVSGAISVIADAFNNLSDAGSSLVTLLGFKLASKKPDADHPFGHGRFEYISGFIVSLLILLLGVEVGMSAAERLFAPAETVFSLVTVTVLGLSVAVKLYMAYYNYAVGKKISSGAMKATAVDSLSDAVSTAVVLACLLLYRFTGVNLDALCGIAVAVFVLFSGIRSARETVSPLLGNPPTAEFTAEIEKIARACPYVCGIHDLVVHDYGPGRRMISLHAEVPANADLLAVHDAIDNTENCLREKLYCDAVIHMDPIQTDDARVSAARETVEKAVKTVDEHITIHDFRMVEGNTHTNVIFDAVLPHGNAMTDKQAARMIAAAVTAATPRYRAVVHIDHPYTL